MGRDRYSHRKVLEDSVGITIQDLIHYGALNNKKWNYKATFHETIERTRGIDYKKKLADVQITVSIQKEGQKPKTLSENNYIQFQYEYEGEKIKFRHQIEIQPVNFGGYRYFFKCNCSKNGKYCGRRVKALYFYGKVYACRHCLELVYQNCRYNRQSIRYKYNAEFFEKKAKKLKQYGHPRKANILQWKAYDYEEKHDKAFMKEMMKMMKIKV